MEKPVNQGKYREAEAIGEWHQGNTDEHNETAYKLIEIFRKIELPALACRAMFAHLVNVRNFPPVKAAIGAAYRFLHPDCDFTIFFTVRTTSGHRVFHRITPYWIK